MEHQFTFVLLEDKAGNEFVWAMNGAVYRNCGCLLEEGKVTRVQRR